MLVSVKKITLATKELLSDKDKSNTKNKMCKV